MSLKLSSACWCFLFWTGVGCVPGCMTRWRDHLEAEEKWHDMMMKRKKWICCFSYFSCEEQPGLTIDIWCPGHIRSSFRWYHTSPVEYANISSLCVFVVPYYYFVLIAKLHTSKNHRKLVPTLGSPFDPFQFSDPFQWPRLSFMAIFISLLWPFLMRRRLWWCWQIIRFRFFRWITSIFYTESWDLKILKRSWSFTWHVVLLFFTLREN